MLMETDLASHHRRCIRQEVLHVVLRNDLYPAIKALVPLMIHAGQRRSGDNDVQQYRKPAATSGQRSSAAMPASC